MYKFSVLLRDRTHNSPPHLHKKIKNDNVLIVMNVVLTLLTKKVFLVYPSNGLFLTGMQLG